TWFSRILKTVSKEIGIEVRRPLKEVSPEKLNKLLYGTGDQQYEVSGENRHGRLVTIYETFSGIISDLERRYSETESEYVRAEIGKYQRQEDCPTCLGKRLKKEALSITINNKSIVDITSVSIKNAQYWLENLEKVLNTREKQIANLIIKEIKTRLSFLVSVGLDYLTLDRPASSLAGGEAQRIRLASQLGTGLSGVLYVLDEPSIGLHQKDNLKLINTLKQLRDLGNTVIVVEHDKEMIMHADYVFDFGPLAGEHGGRIIAEGKIEEIIKNSASLTGKYLSGKRNVERYHSLNLKRQLVNGQLVISGCCENNLKNLKVAIPLKKLVCITGVSGSGKSSLIVDTLYKALASHFNPYFRDKIGKFENVTGLENINRVILIDQSPIGRTPRSNPATYTGCFTYIRDIFSKTPDARVRGYNQGRFSFNVKGGRCEVCQGDGQTRIEMQFLPDVYITCDVCHGLRYNSQTLEVRFKEKNIAEILDLTVGQALSFFANIPGLSGKLETLNAVGLSYIKLGQPAPHLSGGEAQRVKLATELAKKSTRGCIYVLDEPTTGLHFADLEKLLHVLHALVEMGNTVIVIEHNLDIIKNSDWIIDLGPEGGDLGGRVIAQGQPKEVAGIKTSYTGQFLKKIFNFREKLYELFPA
ncbi:excinuclease ABC subunit A, partial [Candidatus Gottesmanbacteria bacterium RIFCSPLOWO2_02_FULL_38_8]